MDSRRSLDVELVPVCCRAVTRLALILFMFMLLFVEIVTGLKFTTDCKNLISVSGDG